METFKKPNYGKLPSTMRQDREIPKRACHLFAVMGSYGPESRAGVEQLAEDIAAKPDTVRKLQKILIKTGWIALLSEGRGGGKEKPGEARTWWLNDYPSQHRKDPATARQVAELKLGSGLKTEEENIPEIPERPEKKKADEIVRDYIRDLPRVPGPEFLRHRQALGIFGRLWSGTHGGEKYIFTGKDQSALKTLLANDLADDFFGAKIGGYLCSTDQFVVGQRHSLSLFCSQFNKWPTADAGDHDTPSLSGVQI